MKGGLASRHHWFPSLPPSPASEHLFVAAAPPAAVDPFADITGTHPTRTAVVRCMRREPSPDTSGGGAVFRPDEPCLRAQYAKVLVEALDLPVEEGLVAPFWDLGDNDPASLYPHDYIAAAYQPGLSGFPRWFIPSLAARRGGRNW